MPQDETTSCHWGQESVRRHPGPSGEPVTVTLLTEHRITLTAKDSLLYPEISASIKPYRRSAFLQRIVINTETSPSTAGQRAEDERQQTAQP